MNNISTLKRRSYIALEITLQNAFTILWHGTHNRSRLQIKCALSKKNEYHKPKS